MGPVARNMAALLSGAAVTVFVGMHGAKAQETQTNEAEKKGRVTLLQRLVLGARELGARLDLRQPAHDHPLP